ncbi:MAG: Glutamine synthetase [Chlamydiia bacterium]|nr:Glutamine synthetase [Chlamydiia bacterium]MCH9615195.1 Glutamine synthetase [Chlamydiia bacterium]MCH9628483.1 Glutamine synthetase [Chlamydiia bacterium]
MNSCVFEKKLSADADLEKTAREIKAWALSKGATHYCHWFQPLTGASAEKHESFLVSDFSANELLRQEPDASSFPHGGSRHTFEARGYTSWDPTSPPFIWNVGGVKTLCIPSVFCSWTGEALDTKIPLLRSEEKIAKAAMRLLNFLGIEANEVYSTLGCEQEYFIVDRSLAMEREDLTILGTTVLGAPPAKGQELGDHYFGSVKERVLAFMAEFETVAYQLGIPLTTRHNEVAPAQHEAAPMYERTSLAVDHNIMLMEVMRKIAVNHGLRCLLNEKPFEGVNGSGKHLNWSLQTDQGLNLLDPKEKPFLILLIAILHAVHKHAKLLRASIASYSNDKRLGGHEAPPAIISAFIGEDLEAFLLGEKKAKPGVLDHKIKKLPNLPKHSSDRNRTSPFAFTGNKFEFRAPGSSQSPAFPMTVINAIVAESLNEILDAIEEKGDVEAVTEHYLKISQPILFSGDNYSNEWKAEAEKRGLPNFPRALDAYDALLDETTLCAFDEVMDKNELTSLQEVLVSTYKTKQQIEEKVLHEMFMTKVLPAALIYQKRIMDAAATKPQRYLVHTYTSVLDRAIEALEAGKVRQAREAIDQIEGLVDDALWAIPKYWQLLYLV